MHAKFFSPLVPWQGEGTLARLLHERLRDCLPGSPADWPAELKTAANIMLASDSPAFMVWGKQFCLLYNDACVDILGDKHPHALGRPAEKVWKEVWQRLLPFFDNALQDQARFGECITLHRAPAGKQDDIIFACTPIYLETGEPGGMYCSLARTMAARPVETNAGEDVRRLHQLVEQAPGFFAVVVGPEHVYEYANAAYKRIVGREDLIGRSVRSVFPELENQGYLHILDKVYASGEPFIGRRMPIRFRMASSNELEEHFVEFVIQPFFHSDRSTRGIIIQGYGVTEQKRAEDALCASQQHAFDAMRAAETERRRLDALLEAAPVGIAMVDAEGRFIRWNRESRRIWGDNSSVRSVKDFSQRKGWWSDGGERHGQRIKPDEWVLVRALKGEETPRDIVEIEPLGCPGERRHIVLSGAPIHDAEGKIIGAVAAQIDITKRMKAERALRESEAMFRTMANAMPQIVWSTLPDGYQDYFNDQWYEFTGAAPGSTVGNDWVALFHPDDRERTGKIWQHSLETGEPYEIEYRILHHSGQYRWTLGRALPVRDEQGKIVRWMGTCTDIHEHKTIQDALAQSEEKFRLLYENAPIGIAHISLDGKWTYANVKLAEITGYRPEELVGLGYLDVTPDEERAASIEVKEKLLAGEIEINREKRILRKDGSTRWIRLTTRMLHDESGKPRYGICIFEDIHERKQAETALRESEERFRATFENAPLGIAKSSLDGMFIRANPKMLELLGYSLDELLRLSILDVVHPADRELTQSNFQKLVSGETASYVLEKRYVRKDGSFVWVNVTTALRYVDGVPQYAIGMFEDVTARRRAEEDLRRALARSYHMASHDVLTGLANRARFNDRLEEALSYAKRDGHLVAVQLLDLDRFKAINDTFGHHTGDLLLKEVANRIKAQTRTTDVVARLGGDEFVIIQTHLATPSAASVLAKKLVEELGRTFILDGQEVNTGASIGIALYPNDAEAGELLIKLADLALYEAKSRGRYNFQFYRAEMGTAVKEAQELEQALRHAMREGQFRLHYQPQFDLESGRISGIEALMRWQHPEKGLLPAADFIREAESAGLMPSLGEWALHTACRQHRKWVDAGLVVPLIFNVSLRQLRHPRFLQSLRDILKTTGLLPSLVQLETSEGILWDPRFSLGLLREMKDIGVRLSLDDFGTELAALSSLHRFPLDVVKPGLGLVKALPRRGQEAAVLAAMISVAHKMKISVCAEGVETADQLNAVKEHGCDAAQGFLLGSPVDESEIDRLIEAELAHH